MSQAQCSNCRFFEPSSQSHQAVPQDVDYIVHPDDGACKRRGWMLTKAYGFLCFGAVQPDDWCGEWEEGKRLAKVGTERWHKEALESQADLIDSIDDEQPPSGGPA